MNRYSRGLALLWSPFFLLAHGIVRAVDAWGGAIPPDGCSPPYLWLCAFGSSLHAFAGPLGLAALYQRLRAYAGNRLCYSISIILVAWNILFMFQWATNIIPKTTPISWSTLIYNQIFVAPKRIGSTVIDLLPDNAVFIGRLKNRIMKTSFLKKMLENG